MFFLRQIQLGCVVIDGVGEAFSLLLVSSLRGRFKMGANCFLGFGVFLGLGLNGWVSSCSAVGGGGHYNGSFRG